MAGCSGTGAKFPAIWTPGSAVFGSGVWRSWVIKVVSTKSRAVAAAFCKRFHFCCGGNGFVVSWVGLVSFVGILVVVGDWGWYCLGKGSVWREHEMVVLVLFLVEIFFFKVIEVELHEAKSLNWEEECDDESLVLIQVFVAVAVDAMVIYFESVAVVIV